jgi:hypothetical protein
MGELDRGLAERINTEHRAVEEAALSAVDHAMRCGEMLEEQKSSLPHGEWGAWLSENFEGSERAAQTYMKLHRERDALNPQRASDLSIRGALAELASPQDQRPTLKDLEAKLERSLRDGERSREQAWAAYHAMRTQRLRMAVRLRKMRSELRESYGKVPEREHRSLSETYYRNLSAYRGHRDREKETYKRLDFLERFAGEGDVSDEEIREAFARMG